MRQTSAHSCSNIVTEILLLFFLSIFHLIFFSSGQRCSIGQRTSLHLAAHNGHTAACQLLISAEADVNATDECIHVENLLLNFCYVLFVDTLFFFDIFI
jgi:hypothetical protein